MRLAIFRGALVGLVALLIGLSVAELARAAGAPPWATVIVGFWAMVIVVAVKKP